MNGSMWRQFTAVLCIWLMLVTPTMVGCDLLNALFLFGGAGAGFMVNPPQSQAETTQTARLLSVEPSRCKPGTIAKLKGESLGQENGMANARLLVGGYSLELISLGDSEATFMVPAFPAGDYDVAIQYPSGTTESALLTVLPPDPATLSAEQMATRVTGNLALFSEAGRDVFTRAGLLNDPALQTDLTSFFDNLNSALSQLAAEIQTMSPEELAYMEAMLHSTGLLTQVGDKADASRILTAKRNATLHHWLLVGDASAFVAGNVSFLAKVGGAGLAVGGLIATATGAGAAVGAALAKIAKTLFSISGLAGKIKAVLDILPCDLQSVELGPNNPTVTAGETVELDYRGDFQGESTFGQAAGKLALSFIGDRFAKALPEDLVKNKFVDNIVQEALGFLGAALPSDLPEGTFAKFETYYGARWSLANVEINMEEYVFTLGRALEKGLGWRGGLGDLALEVVDSLGIADTQLGLGSVESQDQSIAKPGLNLNDVQGVGQGTTTVNVEAYRLETVQVEGEGVVAWLANVTLKWLKIVWLTSVTASLPISVQAAPPVCDNDGVCDAGETNANCPNDCPVCDNDGACEAGETNANCPNDCPVCDNDGLCDAGENYTNCPNDCQPEFSNGTMTGVSGWTVAATINVDPNTGPLNTPIAITVTFTVGGDNVSSIDIQQYGGSDCHFITAETLTGFFAQQSAATWVNSAPLVLTGNAAIARFVAKNAGGTEIAIGDIRLNGGCVITTAKVIAAAKSGDACGAGLSPFLESP